MTETKEMNVGLSSRVCWLAIVSSQMTERIEKDTEMIEIIHVFFSRLTRVCWSWIVGTQLTETIEKGNDTNYPCSGFQSMLIIDCEYPTHGNDRKSHGNDTNFTCPAIYSVLIMVFAQSTQRNERTSQRNARNLPISRISSIPFMMSNSLTYT